MKIGAILTNDNRTYDLTVESEVLLPKAGKDDIARVSRLIRRVVHQADELEQKHLPGDDAALDQFRDDWNGRLLMVADGQSFVNHRI